MANLIAYYSRKGENYWAGSVKNLEKGNTERVAEFVQQAVGGDLFEIETVKDYAADYYQCIDEAKAELVKLYGDPKKDEGDTCTFKASPNTVILSQNGNGAVLVTVY